MAATATVRVDLAKLADNASRVAGMVREVSVVGVTKATCGSPEVGRAMLAGGAVALGESRHENAERLRAGGIEAPIWLLRSPPPERAAETVRLFDLTLVSELATCEALEQAADERGVRHQVVAMVELGDLREGLMPAVVPTFVNAVEMLDHLELVGIGVNLTCYGAVVPDEENLGELAALAAGVEAQVGRPLDVVSGGNSSSVGLAVAGRLPTAVTSLRVGESILLGSDTLTGDALPGLRVDVFELAAPVVECKVKPSLPYGTVARDAYGNRPTFEDRGLRRRAICAIGRQDVMPEWLTPLDPGVEVLGASSDHLICDVEGMAAPPRLGEALRFRPTYAATVQLFTSPYVHKVFTPPA